MNPLVSIIIPVYNGANYVREAIDSALTQTYPYIEILVINDGSCDNGKTREIALSYGDKIRYLEKENGGVSTALNLGIREMKGEYFSWLCHDDLYLPDKIEKEIKVLNERNEVTTPVYCGWISYNMDTGKKYVYRDNRDRYSFNYFTHGTTATVMSLISGCGLLIHKSLFDKYGWFDETSRITQDYDMWFRMFRGKSMIYIDEPLIISREHRAQVTNTNNSYIDECDLFDKYMVDNLRESDIAGTGLSIYDFLNFLMLNSGNHGYINSYNYAKDRLKNANEPQDAAIKRGNLKTVLSKECGNKIYLYCMGKRGRTLFEALNLRGIEISGFSDSDESKWNCDICGRYGVPLEMIPKSAAIIVTKARPYALAKELKEKGYTCVHTYNEIEQLLIETPIDKKMLLTDN